MIIKQQENYAKAAVLLVHLVSEFTHSFSFTPSSELNEGIRGNFGYSQGVQGYLIITDRCVAAGLELKSAGR